MSSMSKQENIEIEIKIKITEEHFKQLKTFFAEKAVFQKQVEQIDTYYTPIYNDFTKETYPYKWLSIRQRGGKNILNYKHFYPEGAKKNTYGDEYEIEISDVEKMDKVLKDMDIHPFAIIEKNRNTYMYLEKYEIALDMVKDLGYFIEIEVKRIEDDVTKEKEKLYDLAKQWKLDLKDIDLRGYPYYYIHKEEE